MNNQKTFAAYLTWQINACICPQCSVELWYLSHTASGSQRALVFARGSRMGFCEPVAVKLSLAGASLILYKFLFIESKQTSLKSLEGEAEKKEKPGFF